MTALTPDDQTVMGRARGLATARGDTALRAWFLGKGDITVANSDTAFLYGFAVGAAQTLIHDLLGIIERVTAGVVLGDADAATMRAALVDAAAWRGDVGYCSDCEALPDGYLCKDHHGDEELCISYAELLSRLGGPR